MPILSHLTRRFRKADKGSIAILSSLTMTGILGAAAVAIDVASIHYTERRLQGATDLAAIAAASDPENGTAVARSTLSDNGFPALSSLTVEAGRYIADPGLARDARFVPNAKPYNAVRVAAASNSPLYFGKVFASGDAAVASTAIATRSPQATFSIGSRLLALDGGVINALLSAMLGSSVQLTVMDYRALANANIDLFDFMDALASEIGIEAGTYREVAKADISAANMFSAMAIVAHNYGLTDARLALDSLSMALGSTVKIPAGSLIDMGDAANAEIGTAKAYGVDATVNALQMISAFAAAADGDHQVQANLDATIPGLSSTTLTLAIGEPPQNSSWIALGEEGAIVRTAQLRLKLETKIGGTGLLSATSVNLPIYVDTAYGEATLSDIQCAANPANAKVTVSARPGILNAYIGKVSNFAAFDAVPSVSKADLVTLPLISVKGSAHADMGNMRPDDLVFTGNEIGSGVPKTVTTRDYLQSITGSLVGNLNLNVDVAGIDLGLSSDIKTLTKELLTTAVAPVDSILYTTLTTLGVRLGEADVWVNGVRCRHAVIVQ